METLTADHEASVDESIGVNCDNCLRRTGSGTVGNHWICEDCRMDFDSTVPEEPDQQIESFK